MLQFKQEDFSRELEETKTELERSQRELKELNHRVANSLQLVSSLLRMQCQRAEAPEARTALTLAGTRVEAIAHFYRYVSDRHSAGTVNFPDMLRTTCNDISLGTGLQCMLETVDVCITGDKALKLILVVNELVMNAWKHAYDGQEAGAVTVTCQPDRKSQMRLCVRDHGKGLPPGFDAAKSNGIGFRMVTANVEELKGKLEVEDRDGVAFTITVPVP